MDRKSRCHIEYRTIKEDNVIGNNKNIGESTSILNKDVAKGPLVMGLVPILRDINSATRTASA